MVFTDKAIEFTVNKEIAEKEGSIDNSNIANKMNRFYDFRI